MALSDATDMEYAALADSLKKASLYSRLESTGGRLAYLQGASSMFEQVREKRLRDHEALRARIRVLEEDLREARKDFKDMHRLMGKRIERFEEKE